MDIKSLALTLLSIPVVAGLLIATVMIGYAITGITIITLLGVALYYTFKLARED